MSIAGEEFVGDGDDRDSCTIHRFTRADVDAVNVANWYDWFKELSPKTILVPIPPEVLKYLKSDGMVMPQNTHTTAHVNLSTTRAGTGTKGVTNDEVEEDNGSWASISDTDEPSGVPSEFLQKISRGQRPGQRRILTGASGSADSPLVEEEFPDEEEDDWDQDCNRSSESSDDDEEENRSMKRVMEVEKFHEFDSLLDASIKKLGGAVLPKINRKSPRDATWIGFNRSLKCYNPGDIYLLLKTSDVVSHLLEDPYKECHDEGDDDSTYTASGRSNNTTSTSPYMLVLKQWNDSWGPEMEFRCFICANQLIAICQRDLDTCYASIVKRKDKLLLNIQNFFLRNIHDRFPVSYYVMDIVCHPNGEIYLVDFDVFGLCTDPLLFTYQELQSVYHETKSALNSSSSNDDNRLKESHRHGYPHNSLNQPCLRFLTESRNFRARKSTGRSALANDVMTYIRESVSKQ